MTEYWLAPIPLLQRGRRKEALLYGMLLAHAPDDVCEMKQSEMAEMMGGVNKRTLSNWLRFLEEEGLIERSGPRGRGMPTRIKLLVTPELPEETWDQIRKDLEGNQ